MTAATLLVAVTVRGQDAGYRPAFPAAPANSAAGGADAGGGLRPAIVDADYRIVPTDILEVSVFQEPDLKSTLRVSPEGTIDFPLIGQVNVGSLTPGEAARRIAGSLEKGYLVHPQVTVTVMEFSKRRFTVLGEVQRPGSYDIPDQTDLTVLQALGMAGGYTRVANPKKVVLMRDVDGRQVVYRLDARRMADGSADAAFQVQPGDVITVAESAF